MKFDINQLIDNLQAGGVEKQASVVEAPEAVSVAEDLRSVLMVKSASAVAAEASDLGRQLARRLMEKSASEGNTPSEVVAGDQLSALTASVEGILYKEAEGDDSLQNQPNIVNADNAALAVAQSQVDAHATQSGGTVETQTAESLKKGLDTPSATGTSEDLARKVEDQSEDANMQKAAAVTALVEQGSSFYDAAGLVFMADSELQKEAAYAELIAEGYDFEDATALIKAASELDHIQDSEMDKQAAFGELIAEGYTFNDAAELVKEAGLASLAGKVSAFGAKAVGAVKAEGANLATDAKNFHAAGVLGGKDAASARVGIAASAASRNKIPLAVAGGTALGAVAANSMTKQAAFSALLDSGYTFNQALATVQA